MLDIRETILAQYANSPSLTGIIERFNAAADPRRLIETFLHDVWNPATATGWGLDVWGRIVGVPRYLKIIPQAYWGFDQALDVYETSRPFNDGIFYDGGDLNARYYLPDETYRRLIFAKAAANITTGSIADINRLLMILFSGEGRIWVRDNGGMSITICHDWELSPVDASLLAGTGLFPRPSGVTVTYQRVSTGDTT